MLESFSQICFKQAQQASQASLASSTCIPIGERVAQIAKTAFSELSDIYKAEVYNFPRVARLLSAVKRASQKLNVELASVALSCPKIAFVVAIGAVVFFYLFTLRGEAK